MKKYFWVYVMILSINISFVGCFSPQKEEKETIQETKIEEMQKKEEVEVEEQEEEIEQEDVQTQLHILNFVDQFGKSYEMEVNSNITPKEYKNENFIHEDNQLSYEDENFYSRLGVDVSYYQGDIDWEKVKSDGYDFAMIRIGYRGYGEAGKLNIDSCFHDNIKSAQDAGLDVGVYFFAQAINEEEALEEAEFVIKNLKGYNLQMPVVYDPENIVDDEARTDDVSGEQFTKNTKVFCEKIKEAGYEPMIYSDMVWEAYKFNLEELSEYPIWYADYEALPQTPYSFTMWQYTKSGKVSGIEGDADINIQFIKK